VTGTAHDAPPRAISRAGGLWGVRERSGSTRFSHAAEWWTTVTNDVPSFCRGSGAIASGATWAWSSKAGDRLPAPSRPARRPGLYPRAEGMPPELGTAEDLSGARAESRSQRSEPEHGRPSLRRLGKIRLRRPSVRIWSVDGRLCVEVKAPSSRSTTPSSGPDTGLSAARHRSRWLTVTHVSSVFRHPCIRSVPPTFPFFEPRHLHQPRLGPPTTSPPTNSQPLTLTPAPTNTPRSSTSSLSLPHPLLLLSNSGPSFPTPLPVVAGEGSGNWNPLHDLDQRSPTGWGKDTRFGDLRLLRVPTGVPSRVPTMVPKRDGTLLGTRRQGA
jgi:hypothetical protein